MKYCWSREIYRFSQQQFFNANFVWNQDEVSQNSRYAKRFYYSRYLSAQSGSCQINQLRSSSLLLGTLSHGAHEPISIVLRTRFLDAPATMQHFDDSGHSFTKIAIPCTILPLAQFTRVLCVTANQRRPADSLLRFTLLQYTITTHFFYSLIKSKHPHTVDEYSQKLNKRKILTVLRRNSIIIVNCSTEYI